MIRRGLAALEAYDTPFDPAVHATDDVFEILEIKITEKEMNGVYQTLVDLTLKNPGIAWLAALPNPYYVVWEQLPGESEPIQLARGRLQAMPTGLATNIAQMQIVCVPPDQDDVLSDYADTLRVGEVDYDPAASDSARAAAERYDPVFFNAESDDPQDVMHASLMSYRWNPVTLALEETHIVDGGRTITISDAAWNEQDLSFENPPRGQSRLRVVANWTQSATGDQTFDFMANQSVPTYHYREIIAGLPKAGDQIGNSEGWSIAYAKVNSEDPLLQQTFGSVFVPWASSVTDFSTINNPFVVVQAHDVKISMRAHYDYQQERSEILDIFMTNGVQTILQDTRVEPIDTISLSSVILDVSTPAWSYEDPKTNVRNHYVVGDIVQASGTCWKCLVEHDATDSFTVYLYDTTGSIASTLWEYVPKSAAIDARNSNYFDTNRGARSFRHALKRLQRIVVQRSLACRLRVRVKAWVARDITCDDAVTILSPVLPGGQVTGKVVGKEWSVSATEQVGHIDIAIPVGSGESPTGTTGYDHTDGIYYQLQAPAVDEPVNCYALPGKAPIIVKIENDAYDQDNIASNAVLTGQDPVEAISNAPTTIRVYYDPLRKEDLITRRLSISTLPIYIKKGIDLTPIIP